MRRLLAMYIGAASNTLTYFHVQATFDWLLARFSAL